MKHQQTYKKAELFTNLQLKQMIVPLFLEQLLAMMVGIIDTFVVSYCGEAAVSGVSLVNSFNTIFIYLFTALASGGAVVISQYLGRKENAKASESASQLLNSSTIFSIVMMILVLFGGEALLRLLFGNVEKDVMDACVIYLKISAYSYPVLAIYNAGTAMFRSIGKTDVTMFISIFSNIINVIGNCIGVFVLHAGVAGVAWPSFIARCFSAVVITLLCFKKKYGISYHMNYIAQWNGKLQKNILKIAVPNGFESGIFQLVKVALSSVVALFGTYEIAANGIAQSFWSLASLVCVVMGPVFMTVIGQCMGAGKIEEADYYFKKLTKITVLFAVFWNACIFAIVPLTLQGYAVSQEIKQLVIIIVLIHNIFSATAFPFADPLGKGLRAAGDVAFPTAISIFTTIGIRLLFSYLFAIVMNMGVIGIALAMALDWIVRGIIFQWRYKKGAWKERKVLAD